MNMLTTGDYLQTCRKIEKIKKREKKEKKHRRGPQEQPNRKKVGYALEQKRLTDGEGKSIFPIFPFEPHTHSRKYLFNLYPFPPRKDNAPIDIDLWNKVVTKLIWMNMKLTGSRVTGHLRGDEGLYNRYELIPYKCDIVLHKCSDYCCYCGVGLNYGVGKQMPYYHDKGYKATPSIDRIDSKESYVYDNIVICCKDCNTEKGDGDSWPYDIKPYIEDADTLKIIKDDINPVEMKKTLWDLL